MIPSPDIIPLPAPYWLFLILLIFTFFIHVIFMNFLFGGTFIASISRIKGRNDPNHLHLAKTLFRFMPVAIALTINFGVAPLLFVQVLYGNLLYSSSILMARPWFSVILLVILGYYGTYLVRFRWDKLGKYGFPVSLIITVVFAVVGFIFVNNMTLMLKPAGFVAHYFKNPAAGTLNWSDLSVYPRYLHMFLGALAVSGLWIMLIGVRKKSGDDNWSDWAVGYGIKVFIYSTVANIVIGTWFLISHPKNITMVFLGENIAATVIFAVSLILTILLFVFIARLKKSVVPAVLAYMSSGVLAAVLLLMIIMRHFLRSAYLEPYLRLSELQVQPQWTAFAVFAAVFIFILLPVMGWMIKTVLKADKPEY